MGRLRITIGVPVYNGEAFLRECLECLAAQTSDEFTVLVMDNASTDQTAAIAAEFAARDRRFRTLRQPRTVDVLQNFADVLAAADTEYFAWRAYDDLCAPDWVERVTALLDANSWASLAASRIVRVERDKRVDRIIDGPVGAEPRTLRQTRTLALSMAAAWIYGLYRREAIQRAFARCRELHRYAWSLDVLVILTFILNRSLIGTDGTSFIARKTGITQSSLQPNYYVDSWRVWRSFGHAATTILRESRMTKAERLALYPAMLRLTDRRSEKLSRIGRGALGAWLLGRDGRVRSGPLVRIAMLP